MKNKSRIKQLIKNNCENQNAYFKIEKRRKIEFKVTNEKVFFLKNGIEEGGNVMLKFQNGNTMYCFSEISDEILKKIQLSLSSNKLLKSSLETPNKYKGSFCAFTKEISLEEIKCIIEQFKEYIYFIKLLDISIVNVICNYKEEYTEKQFFNNVGMDVKYDSFDMAFMIKIIFNVNNEELIETFYDGSSNDRSIVFNRKFDLQKKIYMILSILKLKKINIYTDDYNKTFLEQSVAGTFLHEVIGHLSEADSVENFNNIARGKRLTKLDICVYDEILSCARGYNKFDDEGTLSERQIILDKGQLVGRLNSIETSNNYNEKPCGNARSISYRYPPICRMRHTSMQEGNISISDVKSSCNKAIYLVGSRGGTSGINFSIAAKYGIIIKKGQAVGIIFNPSLQGNVFRTLLAIDAVCNDKKIFSFYDGCGKDDQYPLPVSFSAPSLFFAGGF